MKFVIIIFILLGACTPDALDFSLVSTTPNNTTDNNSGSDAGNNNKGDMVNNGKNDVAELPGAALYRTSCAACHGADGVGGAIWSGSIQGVADISPAVKDGVGTMPALPALSDAVIADIQAFLVSVNPVTRGGQVEYAQKCAGCHGKEGKGVTDRGMQLRYKDPGYSSSITRSGRSLYNFKDSPGGMPAFDSTQLSDVDMAEIWTWLDAFPNETTDEGLYLQFCGNCHGATGKAPEVEQDLTTVSDVTSDVRSGHGGTGYDARTKYMPAWTAAVISDAEIAQMNAHISGL